MQVVFEVIFQTIFGGIGALIKKLFGRPISPSGITETYIGAAVCVAALVIIIAMLR
jgi:hypothetical protein